MASEGGGKIKNKRGHSSSKPYERSKSLLRRITDSIKDVLRPSWLSPEVAIDDDAAVLVRAEPTLSSGDQHKDTVQNATQPPVQSGAGHPSSEQLEGDGLQLAKPSTSGSSKNLPVQPAQLQAYGQQHSTAANTRFSWQQQQTQHMPVSGRAAAQGPVPMVSDSGQLARGFASRLQPQGGLWQTGTGDRARGLPATAASTSVLLPTQSKARQPRLSESEASQLQPSTSSQPDVTESTLFGSVSSGGSASPSTSDTSPSAVQNPAAKRQRLWSPETSRKSASLQPAVRDKPSFKISVFCSPSQNLNDSLHESSFYSGKTTFGGASAYRRRSLNASLPYQHSLPLRKPVKAKPLNTSSNAVLSSSATQILKTLERLSDAKKSQSSASDMDSVLSFTPSSYRRPSRPLQMGVPSRMLEVAPRGPPVSQLPSPATASLAQNHQVATLTAPRSQQPSVGTQRSAQPFRDEDNDVQVVEDVTVSTAARSQAHSLPDAPSTSGSGKMKRAKTYEMRPKARREDEEVVEVPNLRTDFTLPVQNMPSFNLGPMVSLPSTSGNRPTFAPTQPASTSTTDGASAPPLQFTFSSPIHKSAPTSAGGSPMSTEGFQFSSPLRLAQSVPPSMDKSNVSMFGATASADAVSSFGTQVWGSTAPKPKFASFGGVSESKSPFKSSEGLGASGTSSIPVASASSCGGPFKPASQLLSGSVMDVLGGSKSDAAAAASPPVSSGLKPPTSLREGSVMDILGKGESSSSPASTQKDDLMAKFKKPSGTKPGTSTGVSAAPTAPSSMIDLFGKFKKPSGTWECSTCLVQNKPEAAKCVCCDTPKPGTSTAGSTAPPAGSSQSSTAAPGGTTDSLFAKFLKPAGTWDCEVCLVQNKADATKCVACTSPKPGAKQPAGSAAPPAGSSQPSTAATGGTTDSLFAKFLKPAGSWDCEMCLVQNTADATKCVACTSPKPGTKQPAGSAAPPAGSSQSSAAAPGGTTDSLFAKFLKPAGSWDCEMCLVQNKADATKCVACTSPKPGTKQPAGVKPSNGQTDDLFAKFRKPAGSWNCDTCLVSNTEVHTRCVACDSPRPGTQATGSVPSSSSGQSKAAVSVGPNGGFVFSVESSSSSASPFLTGSAASKDSASTGFSLGGKDSSAPGFKFGGAFPSSGGFKFGDKSGDGSAKVPSDSGFKLPSVGNTSTQATEGSSGFKFGDKDSSNSNNASPVSVPVFGTVSQSTGKSDSSPATSVFGGAQLAVSTTVSGIPSTGAGFQFGMAGASAMSSPSVGATSLPAASSTITTASAQTFTFGSAPASTSFSFGTGSVSKGSSSAESGVKTSVTDSSASEAKPSSATFTPIFGMGQPSSSNSLGAAPSLATGGFQFAASTNKDTPAVFGSNLASKVTFSGSEAIKTDLTKLPSKSAAGTFQTAGKSNNEASSAGLFSSGATGKSGDSGPSSGIVFGAGSMAAPTTSSSASGFVFGAGPAPATTTPATTAVPPSASLFSFGAGGSGAVSTTSSMFSSTSQLSSWPSTDSALKPTLPKADLSAAKPTVNGEVGGSASFVFGQQTASPATSGFVFGAQAANAAADSSQPKPTFSFSIGAGSTGGKRTLDQNDTGPSDSKKFSFMGGPAAATGSVPEGLFKFGQSAEGSSEKNASIPAFGGPGSGFGVAAAQPAPFGQNSAPSAAPFSFPAANATPANAATGSTFPTETAPTGFGNPGGLNFSTTPSFNFGSASNTGSAPTGVFQFGTAPTANAASTQPAGSGVFAFGQSAQPADSTTPAHTFPAPSGMGFSGQTGFTIGSGENRPIKKAIRRRVTKK